MECILNRKAEFSAIHRYWLPELSDIENREKFGDHSNLSGVGHNYVLEVSLGSKPNKYGMIENFSDVKKVIQKQIINDLHCSYLNYIWKEFKETLPTPENVARVIWYRLTPYLPIIKVKLGVNGQLWTEYQGKNMEATLTVKTHFSAAHVLALPELSYEENRAIYGKCARKNGHGHNYELEVSVTGKIDPRTGMLVDLVKLEQVIDDYVIEPFDHTFLNKDINYFQKVVPTAENIALYITQLLETPINELGATLTKVKLYETPKNSCEIYCHQNKVYSNDLEKELVFSSVA
jgi:6-pyruvoyltetrahydropterin/6-carboxytetrahydropterin synthase